MPFASVGIFGKFVGIAQCEQVASSSPQASASLSPRLAPHLYPASHKFIKLFEICGAECGAGMPHIRKKDLDFTLSP